MSKKQGAQPKNKNAAKEDRATNKTFKLYQEDIDRLESLVESGFAQNRSEAIRRAIALAFEVDRNNDLFIL